MKAVVSVALVMAAMAFAALAEECGDCHKAERAEFARTAMARAAAAADFRREWADDGRPAACLDCHAPSGGDGVVCRDCHGGGDHPFPRLSVPDACARCHDAPGENTVRHFRASRAAAQGKTCLDCHLPDKSARHAFLGPSDPSFLGGVADVRLSARRDDDGQVYTATIHHRAGHGLPGGTTGRSVWLIVTGSDAAGAVRWRETIRFGWVRAEGDRWEDHTLRVDNGVKVDIADPGGIGVVSVEAVLVYRYAAGPLSVEDPRQVELSRATMTLR